MTPYFGSDETKRLQRKSDALMGWIMDTPGACVTGRIIAADDWTKLGWDVVAHHLQEDGMFGFRWIDPDGVAALQTQLAPTGATLFDWNGFIGDAAHLHDTYSARLARPLPEDLHDGVASAIDLPRMQAFLGGHGITPLSTDLMGGALCPARSFVIKDSADTIVAAGFTGMLQNHHSPLVDCAWMGLIATDPDHRGKGLGSRIMALLCKASVEEMGASRAVAFAAPDNTASIAMLTRAGLTPCAQKSCVAVLSGDRPTR